MRFGLSDLEELPSLKEFEALAREALGSDEGFAPTENASTDETSISSTKEVMSGEWASGERTENGKTPRVRKWKRGKSCLRRRRRIMRGCRRRGSGGNAKGYGSGGNEKIRQMG